MTRSDPATGRGNVPALDHRAEAAERLREAGANLLRWLREEPRRVDDLSDLEMGVIENLRNGRSLLDGVMRAAAVADRQDRERASASRRRQKYATRPSRALDAGASLRG